MTIRKIFAALCANHDRCPVCGYDKPSTGTRYVAELDATFCSSRCRKIFEDGYMVVRGERRI